MPLLKKILKNSPREFIVKWTGTGSDVLALTSLVSINQTLTGVLAPCADIVAVSSTVEPGGLFSLTRNSEIALSAYNNFEISPYSANTVMLTENSSFDINVALSANGTLILKLRKTQGYSDVGTGL
jgi:hypothetical protein